MASAVNLTKSFVSWATRNGGAAALRAVHDQLISDLSTDGGKQLVQSTVNGKSFSFQIPAGLDPTELLPVLLEAANILEEKNADGTLESYLSARRATRTRGVFY